MKFYLKKHPVFNKLITYILSFSLVFINCTPAFSFSTSQEKTNLIQAKEISTQDSVKFDKAREILLSSKQFISLDNDLTSRNLFFSYDKELITLISESKALILYPTEGNEGYQAAHFLLDLQTEQVLSYRTYHVKPSSDGDSSYIKVMQDGKVLREATVWSDGTISISPDGVKYDIPSYSRIAASGKYEAEFKASWCQWLVGGICAAGGGAAGWAVCVALALTTGVGGVVCGVVMAVIAFTGCTVGTDAICAAVLNGETFEHDLELISSSTVERGGTVDFRIRVQNNLGGPYTITVKPYLVLPDETLINKRYKEVTFNDGDRFTRTLQLSVPFNAPIGEHIYGIEIYDEDFNNIDNDSFEFNVISSSRSKTTVFSSPKNEWIINELD